jgi:hypothetical protein
MRLIAIALDSKAWEILWILLLEEVILSKLSHLSCLHLLNTMY